MVLEQLMWSIDYVWCDRVFRIYRDYVCNCDGLALWTKICKSDLEPMASHKWLVNIPRVTERSRNLTVTERSRSTPHHLPRS